MSAVIHQADRINLEERKPRPYSSEVMTIASRIGVDRDNLPKPRIKMFISINKPVYYYYKYGKHNKVESIYHPAEMRKGASKKRKYVNSSILVKDSGLDMMLQRDCVQVVENYKPEDKEFIASHLYSPLLFFHEHNHHIKIVNDTSLPYLEKISGSRFMFSSFKKDIRVISVDYGIIMIGIKMKKVK